MLLSPRPTALLPSTGTGDYSPVTGTKASRPPYLSKSDANVVQSPRQGPSDTSSAIVSPPSASKESLRRPPSRRHTNPQTFSSELSRAESTGSVKSRDSTSSMNRTLSRDSVSSTKKTPSRDSPTSRKAPRQFVVKSKASRIHRPPSSGHLARTPSYGKGVHQMASLTMTHGASSKQEVVVIQSPKDANIKSHPSAGNLARRKALSLSTQDSVSSPPVMRRTLSDDNARGLRRSVSDASTTSSRPRRPSNLARETKLAPKNMNPSDFSEDSDDDDDGDPHSNSEHIEMPIRRTTALLKEPIPQGRRLSQRSPPVPPTLQLRRTSNGSITGTRVVSGLSGIASTPPQLTNPGPGSAAPPFLTTTQAVVTDLPYAPTIVGSTSSAIEKITQLQSGEIGVDAPPRKTASISDSASPLDERTENSTTPSWKQVSLENTRYALNYEAQDMIRRLSNGPSGLLKRASSPSPPTMPSGWTRPERSTRTMQKQVMLRDLEQEASEQHHGMYSPMITRPDSRADYFSAPVQDASTSSLEEDPFLNPNPKLNSELRRIEKELSNLKKFSDPVGSALQRLAERKGMGSPILPTSNPLKQDDSKMSLPSSWRKRFSPDKRDLPLDPSTSKGSTVPPLRTQSPQGSILSQHERPDRDVLNGEQGSRLKEVTKQLWYSWPERKMTQETEETEQPEDKPTEQDTSTITSISPVESKTSRSQSPVERRLFGSGLRQTWGSALALAGLRSS